MRILGEGPAPSRRNVRTIYLLRTYSSLNTYATFLPFFNYHLSDFE
jgi:hypothetical protein